LAVVLLCNEAFEQAVDKTVVVPGDEAVGLEILIADEAVSEAEVTMADDMTLVPSSSCDNSSDSS
jgi:hypothetical protein